MEVGCQRHAQAALPPGETRYSLYRRLGGPQYLSERMQKKLSPLGFDPRTVQPVTSRYTDYVNLSLEREMAWNFSFTKYQG